MRVNQVSFGKIVKVNAPNEVARQIKDIANKKISAGTLVKREISDLFNDISRGEAHTFEFDKRTSYIFSGEEGNKYWQLHQKTLDELVKIKTQIPEKEKAKELMKNTLDNHRENIMKLICDALTVQSIEPTYNNKMKLRSLNIKV